MTKTYKTYRRPYRLLLPLAAALVLLLGTAPVTWGQQNESKPSAPRVKSSPSSPRSSGVRSSPRSSPRTSSRPSSRATSPSTRSGMSRSKAGSTSGKTVTRTYPRSGSGTSVRPMVPANRDQGPRRYDGPWRESNPPRGVHPPSGGSRVGGGSGHDRGHDYGHGHGYYGRGSRGYYPYYYYSNYPRYYGSFFSFGLGYYPHYYYSPYAYSPYAYDYPYYPGYPRYGRAAAYEPQGALDLNVKPKDTQVFVNGYYVGTTGDFDGWPRYLWLDEDTYELIFYKEGYETLVKEIAVRPDLVIDVKLRMQPGKSVAPEELTRYRGESDRSEDDRYDRDRERYDRERYDRERDVRGGDDRGGDDRDRYEVEYGTAPRSDRAPAPPEELEARTEAGRVHVTISPPEASVYLDGRFVGIGGELSSVKEGLLMDPGEHHLQIFYPGHETREQTFTVAAGQEVKVEIDLAE